MRDIILILCASAILALFVFMLRRLFRVERALKSARRNRDLRGVNVLDITPPTPPRPPEFTRERFTFDRQGLWPFGTLAERRARRDYRQSVEQDFASINGDFSRVFQDMSRVLQGSVQGNLEEVIASAEQNLRAAGISVETLRDHVQEGNVRTETTTVRFTKAPSGAPAPPTKKEPEAPPQSWQQRLMDEDE